MQIFLAKHRRERQKRTDRGIYYYTTYDNRQITGVKLHSAELDSAQLTVYPLVDTQQIRWEN